MFGVNPELLITPLSQTLEIELLPERLTSVSSQTIWSAPAFAKCKVLT